MKTIGTGNPFPDPFLRTIWNVLVVWFSAWVLVGLFVVSLDLSLPGGSVADKLFLFLAAALLFLEEGRARGWIWAGCAFAWVALFSGMIEAVGATTGWPFGRYHYTEAFGYRLGGVLPVSVPLAWWIVVLPLYGLSRSHFRGGPFSLLFFIPVFVGTAAVWTDLLLEPVAWLKREYWIWLESGPYYGVPTQNFAGWFGTAVILSLGLLGLERALGLLKKPFTMRLTGILVLLAVLGTFTAAALTSGYWMGAVAGLGLMIFLGGSSRSLVPSGPVGSR